MTTVIDRDLIRRQLDLEEEAHTLGAMRYRQSRPLPWRDETSSEDEEANLPPGKQLLKLAVEPTAELIREKVEAAQAGSAGRRFAALKWLEASSPEEVAYLAARVALNSAVAQQGFQSTATRLGTAIIDHVRMVLFSKKNPAGYVGLVRANYGKTRGNRNRERALRKLLEKEDVVVVVSQSERMQLGAFALEALIEATGLFSLDLIPRGNGDRVYSIRPTEAVEQWLERQHARCELLEPMTMPMIVRPRRWRTPWVGGYLRQSKATGSSAYSLVRQAKRGGFTPDAVFETRDYLKELSTRDLTPVYEAVNAIQETAWEVNPDVLAVVREVWDSGGSIAGLPLRDDRPLPPRPRNIDTDEDVLRAWKRDAAITHADNASNRSKRLEMQQRLWMAERFSKEDAFWFPHSLDFRGRVYPIPNASGFSPQSDDLGKALLRFKEGKPLGTAGVYWLAVHIANLFGVDKVSFQERVDWTYAHAGELIDSAVQPLDGARFWTKADSPWMALAAAIEFAGYLDQGDGYVSHLPIPLDGSNSGLQHFSAMLRDPVGGAAVNLVPAEKPQDVYDRVASKAHDIVSNDDDEMAPAWLGKITRRITKRPTMTYVYSATRFGMHDMVFQVLREIDAERAEEGLEPYLEGADNYAAARYLSHVLYGAIGDVVSAAQGAMAWLRDVARIAADAGKSLEWTTPDGLLVRQAYRNVYAKRVQVHWQGRKMKVTLAVRGSAIDARGQANGIAPNFVHSLDAAHLRAVVREAKAAGIDNLAVIHDSFGTHAADTDTLVRLLRKTLVEQYETDVLERFREEVLAQLPPEWASEIPPPPAKGDLDLNALLHSPYLFA